MSSTVEMTTYRYSPLDSSAQQQQPSQQSSWQPLANVTFYDLFLHAAKLKYGQSIIVMNNPWAIKALNSLEFEISILSSDPRPTEASRAVVDITTKEFTNHCEKEVDESLVKVWKQNAGWTGSRYHFSTTRGVYRGIGGDIGPQVIHLAIAGGSTTVGINASDPNNAIAKTEEQNFDFKYSHDEKIMVPPMSRVKATITSHSVNYEQRYAILFTIPSSVKIPLSYKTSFQQMICCCCGCYSTGFISTGQLCCTLPEFKDENGFVSFVQRGILSWIGEASTIVKDVETL